MMKFGKLATLAMAAILGASLLTGCGSSTDDKKDTAEGSTSAVAESTVPTVSEGKLIMATNAYFPPYEYYEGSEIVGIDVEIAEAIGEKIRTGSRSTGYGI